jgi:hypothetical protein
VRWQSGSTVLWLKEASKLSKNGRTWGRDWGSVLWAQSGRTAGTGGEVLRYRMCPCFGLDFSGLTAPEDKFAIDSKPAFEY